MTAGKVVVAGASGLVGLSTVREFLDAGWEVVAVSRRRPVGVDRAVHLPVDLLDPDACAVFGELTDVTHLVYAALQESPGLFAGWYDPQLIGRNAAMLRNLFDPLHRAARLEHVSLLHGTKAYGVHHPAIVSEGLHVPLREREPRREHPNFYFLQEDYLRSKQDGASWGLTVFRPTVIYGDAAGANMNPLLPILVYAALERQRGGPLHFPGRSPEPRVVEAVDAELVGRALVWAATAPAARGQTFNLTNGDVFVWEHVWPAIAEEMGMQPGEHRPLSLAAELPARDEEWAALVQTHALHAPATIAELTGANSLVYADAMLAGPGASGLPILNSTIEVRRAGFHDCIDTEDMFRKWIRRLRTARIIP